MPRGAQPFAGTVVKSAMRFRLRTLLVVFVLLAISAPWWASIYRGVKEYMYPETQRPWVFVRNCASEEELDQLVNQVHAGMTRDEISTTFGVGPSGGSFGTGSPYELVHWTFIVDETDTSILFEGKFQDGRLKSWLPQN